MEFTLAGGELAFSATTDESGHYAVTVPTSGRYNAMVFGSGEGFPVGSRHVDVHESETIFDIEIPGGALALTFAGPPEDDLARGIQVMMRGPVVRAGFIVPQDRRAVIDGLTPGDYVITARTSGGFATQKQATVRVPDGTEVRATLRLLRQERTLRLRDSLGRPAVGATVMVEGRYLRESEPGAYIFDGATEQDQILVQARGLLPLCHLTGPAGEISLEILPIGEFSLDLVAGSDGGWAAGGSLIGLPGSDCPVAVALFTASKRFIDGAETLQIRGVPGGQYRYHFGDHEVPVGVPGPPVDVRWMRAPSKPH